jgi:plasmid stability protein
MRNAAFRIVFCDPDRHVATPGTGRRAAPSRWGVRDHSRETSRCCLDLLRAVLDVAHSAITVLPSNSFTLLVTSRPLAYLHQNRPGYKLTRVYAYYGVFLPSRPGAALDTWTATPYAESMTTVRIDLPDDQAAALRAKAAAQGLSLEEWFRALAEQSGPASPEREENKSETRPIWEVITDNMKNVPPEDLAALPKDGASQIDHYIYGHPKRDQ